MSNLGIFTSEQPLHSLDLISTLDYLAQPTVFQDESIGELENDEKDLEDEMAKLQEYMDQLEEQKRKKEE